MLICYLLNTRIWPMGCQVGGIAPIVAKYYSEGSLNYRSLSLLILLLCCAGMASGQTVSSYPTGLADSLTVRTIIKRDIKHLSSKQFWGRGYTRQGSSKAAAYLYQRFTDVATKVNGAKVSIQPFQFPVNTFAGKVKAHWGGHRLVAGQDFLVDAACTSIKARYKLSLLDTTVIASDQQSITWLDTLGPQSALVVHHRHLKKVRKLLSTTPNKLGLLVVLEHKLTWSVSTSQDTLPIIYLLATQPHLRTLNNLPATIDLEVEAHFVTAHQAQNVILTIPGTAEPDSQIVVSAHYDHLGSMGTKAWFPGANDNASGVAHLLFLADYYTKHKHRNTLVFIAFAGEEAGLIGSEFYVQQALADTTNPLSQIKYLLNLDLLSAGDQGATIVNATTYPRPYQRLLGQNQLGQYLPLIKPRGKASNSDHYYFGEAGVPALFIYTMGGTKQYHDIYDTVDNCTLTHVRRVLALLISTINN